MALSIRANTRTGTVKALSAFSLLGSSHNAHLFSLAVQRRGLPPTKPRNSVSSTRHFGWFSSTPSATPSAPASATPLSPPPVTTDESSLLNTASTEAQPLITTTSSPELLTSTSSPFDDSVAAIVQAAEYIPPLQLGDLRALDLISWTPAGLVRESLELVNVFTGLPWFGTIVLTTVLWRAALLPLAIKGMRNSARMQPLAPQLQAFRKDMDKAKKAGDLMTLQIIASKHNKLMADNGVSMSMGILVPAVTLPVTLGMFIGIKKMCELPVAQLTQSGLDVLPDLTVPDPTWVLPVLATAAINLQIMVSARDMNFDVQPAMGHVMNFFRVISIAAVGLLVGFPSGLVVTLLTGTVATTIQSRLLQNPAVRRYLDIPVLSPAQQKQRLPSYMESFRAAGKAWRDRNEKMELDAIEQARERKRTRLR